MPSLRGRAAALRNPLLHTAGPAARDDLLGALYSALAAAAASFPRALSVQLPALWAFRQLFDSRLFGPGWPEGCCGDILLDGGGITTLGGGGDSAAEEALQSFIDSRARPGLLAALRAASRFQASAAVLRASSAMLLLRLHAAVVGRTMWHNRVALTLFTALKRKPPNLSLAGAAADTLLRLLGRDAQGRRAADAAAAAAGAAGRAWRRDAFDALVSILCLFANDHRSPHGWDIIDSFRQAELMDSPPVAAAVARAVRLSADSWAAGDDDAGGGSGSAEAERAEALKGTDVISLPPGGTSRAAQFLSFSFLERRCSACRTKANPPLLLLLRPTDSSSQPAGPRLWLLWLSATQRLRQPQREAPTSFAVRSCAPYSGRSVCSR